MAVDKRDIVGPRESAAADGDHSRPGFLAKDALQFPVLDLAKRGLAPAVEYLMDRAAGGRFDSRVQVEEGAAAARGQRGADRALAASHESDEHQLSVFAHVWDNFKRK